MSYGNERFSAYLATSSNSTFNVASFVDKSSPLALEMSVYVRRYGKYVNNKAVAYRSFGADLAKKKSSSNQDSLRNMSADKILKTLPLLQSLVDSLLEFDAHARDLKNGVMTAAFVLLYRDLIRLFAAFNDGIINLLEKFFSFKSRKEARAALDLYKRFLVRMERVADFLKTAEAVGVDRGDIPDLTRAPSSLLEALEGHCLSLESSSSSTIIGQSQKKVVEETEEVAFKRALQEEAELLSKFAQQKQKSQSSNGNGNISRSSTASSATPAPSSSSLLLEVTPSDDPFLAANTSEDTTSCLMTSSTTAFGANNSMVDNNKKIAQDILALFESNSTNMNNMTLSGASFGGFCMTPASYFSASSPSHTVSLAPNNNGSNVLVNNQYNNHSVVNNTTNPFLHQSSSSFASTQPAFGMGHPSAFGATSSSSSFEANFDSAFPTSSSDKSSGAKNKKTSTEEFLSQDFSLI